MTLKHTLQALADAVQPDDHIEAVDIENASASLVLYAAMAFLEQGRKHHAIVGEMNTRLQDRTQGFFNQTRLTRNRHTAELGKLNFHIGSLKAQIHALEETIQEAEQAITFMKFANNQK